MRAAIRLEFVKMPLAFGTMPRVYVGTLTQPVFQLVSGADVELRGQKHRSIHRADEQIQVVVAAVARRANLEGELAEFCVFAHC